MIMENKRDYGFDKNYEENILKKFSFPKLLNKNVYFKDFDYMMSKFNIK